MTMLQTDRAQSNSCVSNVKTGKVWTGKAGQKAVLKIKLVKTGITLDHPKR